MEKHRAQPPCITGTVFLIHCRLPGLRIHCGTLHVDFTCLLLFSDQLGGIHNITNAVAIGSQHTNAGRGGSGTAHAVSAAWALSCVQCMHIRNMLPAHILSKKGLIEGPAAGSSLSDLGHLIGVPHTLVGLKLLLLCLDLGSLFLVKAQLAEEPLPGIHGHRLCPVRTVALGGDGSGLLGELTPPVRHIGIHSHAVHQTGKQDLAAHPGQILMIPFVIGQALVRQIVIMLLHPLPNGLAAHDHQRASVGIVHAGGIQIAVFHGGKHSLQGIGGHRGAVSHEPALHLAGAVGIVRNGSRRRRYPIEGISIMTLPCHALEISQVQLQFGRTLQLAAVAHGGIDLQSVALGDIPVVERNLFVKKLLMVQTHHLLHNSEQTSQVLHRHLIPALFCKGLHAPADLGIRADSGPQLIEPGLPAFCLDLIFVIAHIAQVGVIGMEEIIHMISRDAGGHRGGGSNAVDPLLQLHIRLAVFVLRVYTGIFLVQIGIDGGIDALEDLFCPGLGDLEVAVEHRICKHQLSVLPVHPGGAVNIAALALLLRRSQKLPLVLVQRLPVILILLKQGLGLIQLLRVEGELPNLSTQRLIRLPGHLDGLGKSTACGGHPNLKLHLLHGLDCRPVCCSQLCLGHCIFLGEVQIVHGLGVEIFGIPAVKSRLFLSLLRLEAVVFFLHQLGHRLGAHGDHRAPVLILERGRSILPSCIKAVQLTAEQTHFVGGFKILFPFLRHHQLLGGTPPVHGRGKSACLQNIVHACKAHRNGLGCGSGRGHSEQALIDAPNVRRCCQLLRKGLFAQTRHLLQNSNIPIQGCHVRIADQILIGFGLQQPGGGCIRADHGSQLGLPHVAEGRPGTGEHFLSRALGASQRCQSGAEQLLALRLYHFLCNVQTVEPIFQLHILAAELARRIDAGELAPVAAGHRIIRASTPGFQQISGTLISHLGIALHQRVIKMQSAKIQIPVFPAHLGGNMAVRSGTGGLLIIGDQPLHQLLFFPADPCAVGIGGENFPVVKQLTGRLILFVKSHIFSS